MFFFCFSFFKAWDNEVNAVALLSIFSFVTHFAFKFIYIEKYRKLFLVECYLLQKIFVLLLLLLFYSLSGLMDVDIIAFRVWFSYAFRVYVLHTPYTPNRYYCNIFRLIVLLSAAKLPLYSGFPIGFGFLFGGNCVVIYRDRNFLFLHISRFLFFICIDNAFTLIFCCCLSTLPVHAFLYDPSFSVVINF